MITDIIIDFIGDKISILLTVSGIIIAILSGIGIVGEYFRDKAYYDYYWVQSLSRKQIRSGFHPELLLYSIIITPIVFIFFPYIERLVSQPFSQSLLYGIIIFLAYIVFQFICSIFMGIIFVLHSASKFVEIKFRIIQNPNKNCASKSDKIWEFSIWCDFNIIYFKSSK